MTTVDCDLHQWDNRTPAQWLGWDDEIMARLSPYRTNVRHWTLTATVTGTANNVVLPLR